MRIQIIGVLFAGAAALAVDARAQTKLKLAPSVAVSAISDDNVFTTAARNSDQSMLVSPALLSAIETPRAALRGSYSIDMRARWTSRRSTTSKLGATACSGPPSGRRHGRADLTALRPDGRSGRVN
jgi:hypothetical protein